MKVKTSSYKKNKQIEKIVLIFLTNLLGDIDLTTTTNLAYKVNPVGEKILVKAPKKKINYPTPPKMICDTKYNSDFKTTKFIAPPKLASPAPATIQLKMNKQLVGLTLQDNLTQI